MTGWTESATRVASNVAAAAAAASTGTTQQPSLWTPVVLPYHLSLLPSMFRLLALMFFMPVLILAAGDLIGWAVFKLCLRPLGYASTVRFKDPEPSMYIDANHVRNIGNGGTAGIGGGGRSSSSSRSRGVQLGAGANLSRTSSLPATLRSRHGVAIDELRSKAVAAAVGSAGSPLANELQSHSPTSSNNSSPVMTYSDSLASSPSSSRSPSLTSSPSTSPRSGVEPLPSIAAAASSSKKPSRRKRSHSTSSVSSLSAGLRRYRAPSVGFEGPLLFASGTTDEDGPMSPLRSDDEVERSMMGVINSTGSGTSGEEESEESADEGGLRRRRPKESGGMRRGPGFGFTQMSNEG